MHMEIILALDFDGTLYRLEEHDSEEMLFAEIAETPEETSLVEKTIADLHSGGDPLAFELVLRDMLKGKPLDAIKRAVDRIMPLVDMEEIEIVRNLASRRNVHLHIVSCGTDMLISEFLDRVGLSGCVEGIHSKELLHDDGTFIDFIWHIKGPDDKRRCVENLKERYEDSFTVAMGDGFTDGPMLSASDKGFLIERPGSRHHEVDVDVVSSFRELEDFVDSL